MQQNISSEISKVSKEIVSPLLPNVNLPLELICLILIKLPIENLERLWVFNNDWFTLIKALCLDFYRSEFQESLLWAFLPKDPMVETIPLLPYFGQFLNESWETKIPLADCINLGKFIASQYITVESLNDLLVGIDREKLVAEERYLIQQRQEIPEITITDFFKGPNLPLNWLKIARAYRHVETTLNLLLLAYFIYIDKTSFTESIFLILNKQLTRWLTGSSLRLLIEHEFEENILLSHLIDFALGEGELFLKCSDEKEERKIYQESAKELLYRLTDNDYWSLLGSQRFVLIDAIKRGCFTIIDRFGEKALKRAIKDNPNDDTLLVFLERFDVALLAKILPTICTKSFQKIVESCGQFMTQLLSKLIFEQLCRMVNSLLHEELGYLLGSKPFIAFFEKFDSWDALSKSTLLEKFNAQELLRFAAINVKAVPCIVEKGYLKSKFREVKDFIEFFLRYMRNQAVPEAIRIEIMSAVKPCFTAWEKKSDTDKDGELKYWRLLLEAEVLKDEDLVWLKGQCEQDNPVIYAAILQKTRDLQNQSVQAKQENTPKESNNPILVSNVLPSEALKTVSIPPQALSANKQNVHTLEQKQVQQAVRPTPKKQLQNQENIKQKNLPSTIVWSIVKGLFIGVLVTGVAILLMMFINYQMDVPLLETINNLWIAGIIGAFAEVVATACYLADAKVFGSSGAVFANEKPDNPKPDNPKPLDLLANTTPIVDPAYGYEPLTTAGKTVGTSPLIPQAPKAASLGNTGKG